MLTNFTLSDLVAVSAALLTYTAFAVPPGYVCGWGLNVFDFRRRSFRERLLISLPLSFSVFPIVLYLLGRFLAMPTVWTAVAAVCLGFIAVLYFDRRRAIAPEYAPPPHVLFSAMFAWVLIAVGVLIDIQVGNRLYSPTVIYDYNIRTAFVAALSRAGIPATNPFFYPGHLVLLRYHYFGLIGTSLLTHLWAPFISSRQALIATTAWTGMTLIALVAMYARLSGSAANSSWRRSLICISLLAVTGLDLVPVAMYSVMSHSFFGSLEWWNEPIMSWAHALLWVPHHVHGLIACMTGFLLVSNVRHLPRAARTARLIAAGVCWATAVGTSIHVTFVFAAAMAVWAFVNLHRRNYGELRSLVLAGTMAVVLCLPFLIDLHTAGAAKTRGGIGSPGGPPLELSVRRFPVVDALFYEAGLNQRWLHQIVDAFVLPLNYFMELGLYFVVAAWWLDRRKREQQPLTSDQLAAITLVVTTALICSFVRSGTIANNDLGWRGWLVAQFVLIFWAADLIEEKLGTAQQPRVAKFRRLSRLPNGVAALLIIGMLGSMYEIALTRLFVPFTDAGYTRRLDWLTPDHRIGERMFALRGMYRTLRHELPPSAVVQNNPKTGAGDIFDGEYADRQSAAGLVECGTVFGGNITNCVAIIQPLAALYFHAPDYSGQQATSICRKLGVNVLVLKDTDPAWHAPIGWPVQLQPLLSTDFSRAYRCSP